MKNPDIVHWAETGFSVPENKKSFLLAGLFLLSPPQLTTTIQNSSFHKWHRALFIIYDNEVSWGSGSFAGDHLRLEFQSENSNELRVNNQSWILRLQYFFGREPSFTLLKKNNLTIFLCRFIIQDWLLTCDELVNRIKIKILKNFE